ncbi:TolC family protein [Flammeovirgaceae bacterium SG7u.111]|nr:TolC family protein [Flammeovirgaceae bacterium SG7u.132]WPO36666.1 TolC family protein [Flammeovirgaceae bacterium SG7u.111]
MRLFISITLTLLLFGGVNAQENTLDSYIDEGLENNLALKQENLSVAKSLERLRQAKGLYMPDISFNSSYTIAGGGRSIAIPIGDLLNPVYKSLNQLNETNQFPTDLPNSEEQFLPNKFHDTRVEIRQALFDPDIYHNYQANKYLAASLQSKRDVYKQELVKEIKSAYYQYLTTVEALEIYASTEKLLQEILRVNKKLVENNKATVDVVYLAEYEISDLESQVAEAKRLQARAMSYFNFLLNRDLTDSIIADKNLGVELLQESAIAKLQEDALENRKELDQLTNSITATEQILALNKNTRLPKLSVGANFGYQGFNYEFNSRQDYYLLQFNMSFPIFKGFQNKSKIQESKIEISRLQTRQTELEEQIKFQVINAYKQVEAGKSSVKAKQAALKSSQKSFEIIGRKYLENQITLLNLLDARTKYTNAQLELVVAKYDLLEKEAVLERTIAVNQ